MTSLPTGQMKQKSLGLCLKGLLAIPMLLCVAPMSAHAFSVMGICTWIRGDEPPRKQSCTMQNYNAGSMEISTQRRVYKFDMYHTRGGYRYNNRIFQLHGSLGSDSDGSTSFSLVSTEANKPFRKVEFQSENP